MLPVLCTQRACTICVDACNGEVVSRFQYLSKVCKFYRRFRTRFKLQTPPHVVLNQELTQCCMYVCVFVDQNIISLNRSQMLHPVSLDGLSRSVPNTRLASEQGPLALATDSNLPKPVAPTNHPGGAKHQRQPHREPVKLAKRV